MMTAIITRLLPKTEKILREQKYCQIASNRNSRKRRESGQYQYPSKSRRGTFRVRVGQAQEGWAWKRVVTKITFVDPNLTRQTSESERFIQPRASPRMKKAHVPREEATERLDT